MENKLKISIITVVYNGEVFLEETIQSIINQTYENIEYIIIDGGSTDGTIDIIKRYEDKITYWVSEPDKGIYDAMNKGIKIASGKWVNLMNASDIYYNNNVISDIFNKRLDVDYAVIAGSYQMKDTGLNFFPQQKLNLVKYGELLSCHQSLFFNKINLKNDIYYDTTYSIHADNDIMMRIVKYNYRIYFSNSIVSIFETGGISSRVSKQLIPEKYKIIFKNFGIIGIVKSIIFNKSIS